jgi:glycosyltransferase involved in cell wall biosynthesis
MKAAWFTGRGSNDTYWRSGVPAKALGIEHRLLPISEAMDALSKPSLTGCFPWYLTEEGAVYPEHDHDVIVWTRPDQVRALHALAMQEQNGCRIVSEVDDNYVSPAHLSLQLKEVGYSDTNRASHMKSLALFDSIIFSTTYLRDYYVEQMRRIIARTFDLRRALADTEMHVCGNHVDPDDWPTEKEQSIRLRIGWMGSQSHLWDLELARPALQWASEAGHEVVLIGYKPAWRFPFRHIPWRDPKEFDRQREAWPLDIGLIPLRRDEHSLGRSDVKTLEYAMSDTAVIAQNVEVYSGTVRHGETGFLAGSPAEFLHWTKVLCENPRTREDVIRANADYVRSERTIHHHLNDWKAAIFGDAQGDLHEPERRGRSDVPARA